MTRADVIAEARSWIGTRWVHQAACKNVGADCLHYIAAVALHFGSAEAQQFFDTPEYHSYGRHPDPTMLFGGCDALMDRIEVAAATVADVLVFNCGRHPMHFGFIADGGGMIHAYLKARRVCEHRLDDAWRSRIVRAYQLRGIT